MNRYVGVGLSSGENAWKALSLCMLCLFSSLSSTSQLQLLHALQQGVIPKKHSLLWETMMCAPTTLFTWNELLHPGQVSGKGMPEYSSSRSPTPLGDDHDDHPSKRRHTGMRKYRSRRKRAPRCSCGQRPTKCCRLLKDRCRRLQALHSDFDAIRHSLIKREAAAREVRALNSLTHAANEKLRAELDRLKFEYSKLLYYHNLLYLKELQCYYDSQ